MNPLEEYDKYKRRKTAAASPQRTQVGQDLVAQWQAAHQQGAVSPELTSQVLGHFKPLIQYAVNRYKSPMTGPGINTAANNLAIDALKSYDPSKAAFGTHLTTTLQRLQRENNGRQSAYIPEAKAALLGHALRAHDELVDELGRKPTPEEHEARFNELLPENRRPPAGTLSKLLDLNRRVVPSSRFESSLNTFAQGLEEQNVALARYDLPPVDQRVYDSIYQHGVSSTGDIAKRLGMSAPAVSRAKKRIAAAITGPGTGSRTG